MIVSLLMLFTVMLVEDCISSIFFVNSPIS